MKHDTDFSSAAMYPIKDHIESGGINDGLIYIAVDLGHMIDRPELTLEQVKLLSTARDLIRKAYLFEGQK